MELKLIVILYLTTIPLNVICISINKVEDTRSTSLNTTKNDTKKFSEDEKFETKPDPSALVIPGYNLPGPIFNDGKPFYAEKDPVTGQIDFNTKTSSNNGKDSFLEYSDDYAEDDSDANLDIFDKANIDRKDGGYGSHRPNDINQLTPNFHDFLNLPVKYNPDKYVYPLISSSYANTKIQGNVNRYNHKNYEGIVTTVKPTASPTYYTTKQSVYYNPKETYTTPKPYTTAKPKTTQATTVQTTTTMKPATNLLNSAMNHPSYQTTEETYEDYDYFTTKAPTKKTDTKQQTEKTTHRPYSIFDELFGDYEEPKPIKPPLFGNLGNYGEKITTPNKDKDSAPSSTNTKNKIETQTHPTQPQTTHNSHGIPATNYNNQNNEYDYEEDYFNGEEHHEKHPEEKKPSPQTVTPGVIKTSTSIVTESSLATNKGPTTEKVQAVYSNFHQNSNYYQTTEKINTTPSEKPKEKTDRPDLVSFTTPDSYEDYDIISEEKTTKPTQTPISITESSTPMRVTSMPLGENHPSGPPAGKLPPIIAMTHHNIKEQLQNEKVDMNKGSDTTKKEGTSYSVVEHDDMEEEKDQTFFSNSFRPLYTQQNVVKQPELDEKGAIKEKLHFTGTGQTNSNYSWTVPTQNFDNTYSSFDPVAIKNLYNQEIQSNYSWKIPENNTPHKKYVPEVTTINKYSPPKTNSLYKPMPNMEFNLQQVSSGYSIGQPLGPQAGGQKPGSYSQGQVFNVGLGLGTTQNGGDTTKTRVPQNQNYQFMSIGTNYNMTVVPTNSEGSATVNIQPLRGSEASLSIGSPTGEVKTVPGQVMDEKLDLKDEQLRKKPSLNKVVFPDDDKPVYSTSSPSQPGQPNQGPNREILSLYSKPLMHQLPADLTPPGQNRKPQPQVRPVRPPWDPRPGHFYQGKPEYARPPRPPMKPEGLPFKRIDGLPNILPQFRPNAKVGSSNGHYHDNIPINPGYMQRQPLLDRPSNRPIGFFEKLHPPPPPKRILELRKPVTLSQHLMKNPMEQKGKEPSTQKPVQGFKNDQYNFQKPPTVPVNRRNGEDESEIATLQMLHAKQQDKLNTIKPNVPPPFKINFKEPTTVSSSTEKPLYVVYPVNTSPLKLDVLDDNEKETVVIGQRVGENPLPPSKIQDSPVFAEPQKPILKPKDRNDGPILKTKPTGIYPIKTEFPYPLERPDTGSDYRDTNKGNEYPKKYPGYQGGNTWGMDTESRIVSGNKLTFGNEPLISATLKTYTHTASPIAIAYTPTEPSQIRYSRPNVASSVIPEIRDEKLGEIINGKNKIHQPGGPAALASSSSGSGSEFTVSAVMHTHQQNNMNMMLGTTVRRGDKLENHKPEVHIEPSDFTTNQEFQAPFQASVNIGAPNNGWSIIRDRSKDIDRSDTGVTTIGTDTTTEFDIENFKPQMFGGFKPIFTEEREKEREKEEEHHSDDLDLE